MKVVLLLVCTSLILAGEWHGAVQLGLWTPHPHLSLGLRLGNFIPQKIWFFTSFRNFWTKSIPAQITLFLASILLWGLYMLATLQTPDKFDDPKGPRWRSSWSPDRISPGHWELILCISFQHPRAHLGIEVQFSGPFSCDWCEVIRDEDAGRMEDHNDWILFDPLIITVTGSSSILDAKIITVTEVQWLNPPRPTPQIWAVPA